MKSSGNKNISSNSSIDAVSDAVSDAVFDESVQLDVKKTRSNAAGSGYLSIFTQMNVLRHSLFYSPSDREGDRPHWHCLWPFNQPFAQILQTPPNFGKPLVKNRRLF